MHRKIRFWVERRFFTKTISRRSGFRVFEWIVARSSVRPPCTVPRGTWLEPHKWRPCPSKFVEHLQDLINLRPASLKAYILNPALDDLGRRALVERFSGGLSTWIARSTTGLTGHMQWPWRVCEASAWEVPVLQGVRSATWGMGSKELGRPFLRGSRSCDPTFCLIKGHDSQ